MKRFFLTQKYRLEIAASFLIFVNFALLSITASNNIRDFLSTRMGFEVGLLGIVITMAIGVFFGMWFFGYVLDRWMRFPQEMNTIGNIRNVEITEILSNTREIKKWIEREKQ